LRAVPAFFAAAAVYVTSLLAAELGGGAFARVLAALVVFFAPVLMNFGMKVSPDTIGLWLWPLAALYTLRLAKGGNPRGWLAVGAVIGVSLQSKYSVMFFFAALLLGLLLTPERRILFSRWFLWGCGVCGLIALPNFLWQAYYGFPMLELLRNGQHGKNLIVGPVQYLFQQLLMTNVFLSLVWIIGLVWLLWNARLRFLGYTYLILMVFMVMLHGKHYYPADVYPYLMAAAGVAIEAWTNRWKVLRPVVTTAVIVLGLVFVPFAMPILPEESVVSYSEMLMRALRLQRQTLATERQRPPALPSDWADMHGWPQLAAAVGNVYQSLSPSDRAQAAIVAGNYGEAAAIDFFGRPYGLPPVISGHNQYYLWGTHGYSGNVVIDVAGDCGAGAHLFKISERAATFTSPWIMPYEDGIPIMVCRGIQRPLAGLWPKIKAYR
jgi:4-amino-4-deoxy-L-arabinose transferase-like glycosyltransferase